MVDEERMEQAIRWGQFFYTVGCATEGHLACKNVCDFSQRLSSEIGRGRKPTSQLTWVRLEMAVVTEVVVVLCGLSMLFWWPVNKNIVLSWRCFKNVYCIITTYVSCRV